MKLKHHIIRVIREYPTMYKATTWEYSKLLVLHHLFLVNGNGMYWYDGYLSYSGEEEEPYGKRRVRNLSDDFFEKRSYKLKRWPAKDAERWLSQEKIVESKFLDQEGIDDLNRFSEQLRQNIIKRGKRYYEKQYQDRVLPGSTYQFTPYPICQYACLVEMPDDVRPDWLEGAHIIVDSTLEYFADEDRYKPHYYYPSEKKIDHTKYEWERKEKEGRFQSCVIDIWGALPNETPEEYVIRSWENFLLEQLKYLNDFKARFPNGII